MRHATPEDLERLSVLLADLRHVRGLTERSPGVFYRRSRAFLHFHHDPTGMYADVRLGDALKTLADVEAPVDMVLLDGWKDGYLPMLKMLAPKLRPKAVVLADNIYTFKKTLRSYVEYMQSGEHGFVSTTLDISDGFEMSVFTG